MDSDLIIIKDEFFEEDDDEGEEIDEDELREQNEELLDEFEKWLAEQGLSENTINKHASNIDFYINEYLLYYDTIRPEAGGFEIDEFLGNWFIRKAMWSDVSQIKAYATAFKKFYTFLYEKGAISADEHEEIIMGIKEGLPDWIDTMERYMSPDFSFEDWMLMTNR
jgi:site-specific recombinase XerD